MSKANLLKHLQNDIYCRLGVSKISGVGIFAIKDIPKGIDPFKSLSQEKEKIIRLEKDDFKGINKNVVKLVGDFFGSQKGTRFDVLYYGPNHLNISYYLNHSDTPNIDIIDTDENLYLGFITNRIIKENEELTINYNVYDEI